VARLLDSPNSNGASRFDLDGRSAQVAAWDRVLHRIFSSGLVVAVVLHRDLADDVHDRLCGVVDELDRSVREIRAMALELAISGRTVRAEPEPAESAAPFTVAHADPDGDGNSRRRLRRVAETAMFAYAARGTGFFRASDRTLWAHEHDGLLLSARSGTPLAHRIGNVFYDFESDRPLYIEDAHAWPGPAESPDGVIE
jgi:hypothetical protein